MAIPTAAKPVPLDALDSDTPIVDPNTGVPTLAFLNLMQKWRSYNLAGNRLIPCIATGKNIITLTPFDASPLLTGYKAYDRFVACAAQTSDGAVTATVVPQNGTLGTLKVYVDATTQAGAGNVVADTLYDFVYAPHLDSDAGGFFIK